MHSYMHNTLFLPPHIFSHARSKIWVNRISNTKTYFSFSFSSLMWSFCLCGAWILSVCVCVCTEEVGLLFYQTCQWGAVIRKCSFMTGICVCAFVCIISAVSCGLLGHNDCQQTSYEVSVFLFIKYFSLSFALSWHFRVFTKYNFQTHSIFNRD